VAYLRPYRVAETATTTGTGAITLAGAVTGYSSFAAELANADTATIVIEAIDAAGRPTGDWEVCDSTFTAPATLSRGTIKDSSAGGSRINFAAGSKRVFAINPRDAVDLGSTDLIGTLPVAKGGTGSQTFTSGRLLVGQGSSAVTSSLIADNGTTVTVNGSIAVTGGTINGTTVGDATASTGAFTTLSASGAFTTGSSVSFNSLTAAMSLGGNHTTGVFTIGGASGTGILTLGRSTVSQTTNIQAGVTASGSTKTINLGTGGASGSTTTIIIGGTAGTSTTTLNGTVTLANALPLTSGGTGQTTKAAAFNALSPITTTGDLILGNGTNSNTRLGIGANGYVLTSNGTTASWQPAAGGGGGVTSFSAGSTGFFPSSATTGAITLSGTLGVGSGGTGTSSFPSNGQLLIGNGSSYNVNNLTAGANITITNTPGAITIAAAGGGGGGPTISTLSMSTSSGSFNNYAPSSAYSKPLIGYTVFSPSYYGAFYFKNFSSGYLVSSGVSISSMSIVNSAGTTTSYMSGVDFSGSPFTFSVYDDIVTCYGLSIYSAGMQTLFSDSKNAITSPSLAPLDAQSAVGFTNPSIVVSAGGPSYSNASGQRGVVVSKSGSIYYLDFASADLSSAFPSVNSIGITVNSSSSSYSAGVDFNVFAAENNANGRFSLVMTPTNATLQTLLDNSFLS
jgi:hypothetical protein